MWRYRWPGLLIIVAGLVVVTFKVAACAPGMPSISAPVRRGQHGPSTAAAEARALWVQRADPTKLEAAIAAWKRAVAEADDDATSWLMLAHATYFLGDGVLDIGHTPKQVQARVFANGAAYADRGLRALSPLYEHRRRAGLEPDEAARDLGPEAMPYLYWWALGTMRWAEKEGWTAGLRVYKHVQRAMAHVERVIPAYDHGGADRYFGAFYSQAPGIAGGDPQKGLMYFERAIALAPMYLDNHLVMAHRYALTVHDRRRFAAALRFVADTPSSAVPESIAEQEITKTKARMLAAKHRDLLTSR